MVPVSVPPSVPVPVFRVNVTSVSPVTFEALPLASCDWTVTEKPGNPAVGVAGFTAVIANREGGPITRSVPFAVAEALFGLQPEPVFDAVTVNGYEPGAVVLAVVIVNVDVPDPVLATGFVPNVEFVPVGVVPV